MEKDSERKPASGDQPAPSEQTASPPPVPGPVPPRSPRLRTLGIGALTILLYLALIDAAVETFLSGSTAKWIVGGAVVAYVGVSVALWRRLGWTAKAIVSFLMMLALIAVTVWLPYGLVEGVTVARQPTSTVLSAATVLIVLLAAWTLLSLRFVPLWGKGIIGALAAYGLAAFAQGIATGVPYPNLFHGQSLWNRLPSWLQGAVIGALVLSPAALLVHLGQGVLRVRGARLRRWAVQALTLSMGVAIAVAGLAASRGMAPFGSGDTGPRPAPTPGPIRTPPPSPAPILTPQPSPTPAIVPSPAGERVEAVLAREITDTMEAKTPATEFPDDAEKIYVVVKGKYPDIQVEATWIAVNAEGMEPNTKVGEAVYTTHVRRYGKEGPEWLALWMDVPHNRPPLPPGDYRVDMDVHKAGRDTIKQSLPFKVVSVPPGAAPQLVLSRTGTFTGTLFFSVFTGCDPGNVNKVSFTYVVDSTFTLETPQKIACTPNADGLIFTPDGDLLVGGMADVVYKVNPETGKFSSVKAGGPPAYHAMLDPTQTQAWVSGIPGLIASIPLNPFADGTAHALVGDDRAITHMAWDHAGNAFYTTSGSGGHGHFGRIDLTTFTTTRLLQNLPGAHGMTFDPFTRNLILFGANHITQISPGPPPRIVSGLVLGDYQFDQGSVDGKGHIFVASNTGHLAFVDYSATGKVGHQRNFKSVQHLMKGLDDIAPLIGPGPRTVTVTKVPFGEVLVRYAPEVQALNRNLEIIFDSSGSMNNRLGQTTRLAVAKQVLADLVRGLPQDTTVALRVFGHRRAGRASCGDTELLVPPGPVAPGTIVARVNALHARGDTALVANLLLAARDLAGVKAGTVVAITDGEETCGGNLNTVAAQLRASRVELVVNIVGFALADPKAIAAWKHVAEGTGGRFFEARDAAQLTIALREATRLGYVVYNQKGILEGTAEVGRALRLPPGTYTVVVRANQAVKVEGVNVSPNASTTFVLQRKGPTWSLTPAGKP